MPPRKQNVADASAGDTASSSHSKPVKPQKKKKWTEPPVKGTRGGLRGHKAAPDAGAVEDHPLAPPPAAPAAVASTSAVLEEPPIPVSGSSPDEPSSIPIGSPKPLAPVPALVPNQAGPSSLEAPAVHSSTAHEAGQVIRHSEGVPIAVAKDAEVTVVAAVVPSHPIASEPPVDKAGSTSSLVVAPSAEGSSSGSQPAPGPPVVMPDVSNPPPGSSSPPLTPLSSPPSEGAIPEDGHVPRLSSGKATDPSALEPPLAGPSSVKARLRVADDNYVDNDDDEDEEDMDDVEGQLGGTDLDGNDNWDPFMFTPTGKWKAVEVDTGDGIEEQQADHDDEQIDGVKGGWKKGPMPKSAKEQCWAKGAEVKAWAEQMSKTFGQASRNYLIEAGLGLRVVKPPNPWNMYQQIRYLEAGPDGKSDDATRRMVQRGWEKFKEKYGTKESEAGGRVYDLLRSKLAELEQERTESTGMSDRAIRGRIEKARNRYTELAHALDLQEDIVAITVLYYLGASPVGKILSTTCSSSKDFDALMDLNPARALKYMDELGGAVKGQKLSRTLGIKIGGKFVVELFDSKVEQKKAGKKAEKKAEHNANDSGEDEVDPPEDDVAEEPPKAKTTKRGGKRKRDGSDTNAEYEYRDDTRKILTAHTQREIGIMYGFDESRIGTVHFEAANPLKWLREHRCCLYNHHMQIMGMTVPDAFFPHGRSKLQLETASHPETGWKFKPWPTECLKLSEDDPRYLEITLVVSTDGEDLFKVKDDATFHERMQKLQKDQEEKEAKLEKRREQQAKKGPKTKRGTKKALVRPPPIEETSVNTKASKPKPGADDVDLADLSDDERAEAEEVPAPKKRRTNSSPPSQPSEGKGKGRAVVSSLSALDSSAPSGNTPSSLSERDASTSVPAPTKTDLEATPATQQRPSPSTPTPPNAPATSSSDPPPPSAPSPQASLPSSDEGPSQVQVVEWYKSATHDRDILERHLASTDDQIRAARKCLKDAIDGEREIWQKRFDDAVDTYNATEEALATQRAKVTALDAWLDHFEITPADALSL